MGQIAGASETQTKLNRYLERRAKQGRPGAWSIPSSPGRISNWRIFSRSRECERPATEDRNDRSSVGLQPRAKPQHHYTIRNGFTDQRMPANVPRSRRSIPDPFQLPSRVDSGFGSIVPILDRNQSRIPELRTPETFDSTKSDTGLRLAQCSRSLGLSFCPAPIGRARTGKCEWGIRFQQGNTS